MYSFVLEWTPALTPGKFSPSLKVFNHFVIKKKIYINFFPVNSKEIVHDRTFLLCLWILIFGLNVHITDRTMESLIKKTCSLFPNLVNHSNPFLHSETYQVHTTVTQYTRMSAFFFKTFPN